MSDSSVTTTRTRAKQYSKPKPVITLPNGQTLRPIRQHAARYGVTPKTLLKYGFARGEIGAVLYASDEGVTQALADRIFGSTQPRRRA